MASALSTNIMMERPCTSRAMHFTIRYPTWNAVTTFVNVSCLDMAPNLLPRYRRILHVLVANKPMELCRVRRERIPIASMEHESTHIGEESMTYVPFFVPGSVDGFD